MARELSLFDDHQNTPPALIVSLSEETSPLRICVPKVTPERISVYHPFAIPSVTSFFSGVHQDPDRVPMTVRNDFPERVEIASVGTTRVFSFSAVMIVTVADIFE